MVAEKANVFIDHVLCVAYSPDGLHIACGCLNSNVKIIDAVTLEVTPSSFDIGQHTREVRDIAYTPDCAYVVTASFDETLRVTKVGDPVVVASNNENVRRKEKGSGIGNGNANGVDETPTPSKSGGGVDETPRVSQADSVGSPAVVARNNIENGNGSGRSKKAKSQIEVIEEKLQRAREKKQTVIVERNRCQETLKNAIEKFESAERLVESATDDVTRLENHAAIAGKQELDDLKRENSRLKLEAEIHTKKKEERKKEKSGNERRITIVTAVTEMTTVVKKESTHRWYRRKTAKKK